MDQRCSFCGEIFTIHNLGSTKERETDRVGICENCVRKILFKNITHRKITMMMGHKMEQIAREKFYEFYGTDC